MVFFYDYINDLELHLTIVFFWYRLSIIPFFFWVYRFIFGFILDVIILTFFFKFFFFKPIKIYWSIELVTYFINSPNFQFIFSIFIIFLYFINIFFSFFVEHSISLFLPIYFNFYLIDSYFWHNFNIVIDSIEETAIHNIVFVNILRRNSSNYPSTSAALNNSNCYNKVAFERIANMSNFHCSCYTLYILL